MTARNLAADPRPGREDWIRRGAEQKRKAGTGVSTPQGSSGGRGVSWDAHIRVPARARAFVPNMAAAAPAAAAGAAGQPPVSLLRPSPFRFPDFPRGRCVCRGGRCPLGLGDAGAERLPAGFPGSVGASDSQGRGSARGAAALASEDAPGQCRRPPSAVWMSPDGCGRPPFAVWTSHAVEDAPSGRCGRPPSAVWTSPAVEDTPRRVWTPRCGCGRTSAGVDAPS